MSEYPTINDPEYIEKGFGAWWHKCGQQAVKQEVEVKDE